MDLNMVIFLVIKAPAGIRTVTEPSCVATSAETLEVRSTVGHAWTLVQAGITGTAISTIAWKSWRIPVARYPSWGDTLQGLCPDKS